MKRVLSAVCAILTVVMILSLTACGDSGKLAGTYRLVSVGVDDQVYTADQLDRDDALLTIDQKNNATVSYNGEAFSLTFNPSACTFTDAAETSYPYLFDGDILSFEYQETTFEFIREESTE